jgi:hypothetical protein
LNSFIFFLFCHNRYLHLYLDISMALHLMHMKENNRANIQAYWPIIFLIVPYVLG